MSQNLPESTAHLTNADFAHKIGVSEKTVQKKRKAGMSDLEIADQAETLSFKHNPFRNVKPVSTPEGFCLQAEAAPASLAIEATNEPSEIRTVNLEREKTKLAMDHMELAKRRGQLIDRRMTEIELGSILTELRDQILALPDRLAPRLALTNDAKEVRMILMDAAVQLLQKVSSDEDRGVRAA